MRAILARPIANDVICEPAWPDQQSLPAEVQLTTAICRRKGRKETDAGTHTPGEKMDLDVRGSWEDTRHGTGPSIKHLMSDSHRQERSGEEELQLSHPQSWASQETVSMEESGPGVEAEPGENNPCCLHVVVAGPQGSPLEGGIFKLELFLPEEYPTAAPKVCLMMQDKSERICSDILKVLLSIQALISAPSPDDPSANDVAEQRKTDKVQTIETRSRFSRLSPNRKVIAEMMSYRLCYSSLKREVAIATTVCYSCIILQKTGVFLACPGHPTGLDSKLGHLSPSFLFCAVHKNLTCDLVSYRREENCVSSFRDWKFKVLAP
ncbi:hypothetical protein U0070_001457, partial [Myodes glareolus]